MPTGGVTARGGAISLSLSWPSSFSPFKAAKLSEKELNWFRNFSCREASCFKPSDRAFVIDSIRKEFGSEENFDLFVATSLERRAVST